jgi:hypothetical protein
MTAKEITELLRRRYSPPEWAFFSELRVGTGYVGFDHNQVKNPEQRLDGWAINCWPSKGLTSIAFEIKVSRSDFLSEIANPDKRQQAIAHSNEFYFVTPAGLIGAEEVPEECGLMIVKDDALRIVKRPATNNNPLLKWQFVASIARRTGDIGQEPYRVEKRKSSRLENQLRKANEEKQRLRRDRNKWQFKERLLKKKNPELWEEIHREVAGDEPRD